MTKLFIDTSGWASFFDNKEPTHRQAVQILTTAYQNQHTIVTSNYILAELQLIYSDAAAQYSGCAHHGSSL